MKRPLSLSKTLLATAALTALVTSAVRAQGGINLSWNDCGTFGQMARTSACTSNIGVNLMFGSAIAPHPIGLMVAMAAVLDLQTNQAALTPWWNMDTAPAPPGCRTSPLNALSALFDLTSGPFNCGDIWGGGAVGGMDYKSGFGAPNRGRIRLVCAVPAPIEVDNATENYYFRVTISNRKTVGTGSCAGCLDGACIVFNSLELDQIPGAPGGDTFIFNPLNRQYITWQAGGGGVAGGCPQAVPTQSKTWGSVKSLYR